MANEVRNNAVALLLGAAIGVGIGILIAPDKGSKTREKIKDSFVDFKIDVNNKLADYEEEIRSKLSASKFNIRETITKLIADSDISSEDAIKFLEKKILELKE